jgi:DNA-binding Lrp family transcriptional regulator
MLDALDKRIIAAMQEDLPLVPEPYQEIANRLGISEAELLQRLTKYYQSGVMRKMGVVLRHREVGYAANALCAWVVPENRIDEIGALMSAHQTVTHCYARTVQTNWPYNFYTMLHAHTRRECQDMAAKLAAEAGLSDYTMLFSTREWKKTSMHYFREAKEHG